ncbi:MAG: zinc ribbon domain-containing protein [Deltaproteobacteria bacterium]|nr:zinc ribbon domain-containing protein [Deltaproteobacteria bacterium]
MPIYEYECQDCGRRFEELARMGEEKAPACPKCRSTKTRKLLSACSVSPGKAGTRSTPSCTPGGGFS